MRSTPKSQPKVGGDIARYNLIKWWLNTLTEEEREIIRSINFDIDEGPSSGSSQSIVSFLSGLTMEIYKPEHYVLAKKILDKAETYIHRADILDKHYFYMQCIKVHYRNRETDATAFDLAVKYCKKQIAINKEAAEWELIFTGEQSPHVGFKQLAIIYEKQGKLEEALELTKEAQENGWNPDDCPSRIARLEKKIAKVKNG